MNISIRAAKSSLHFGRSRVQLARRSAELLIVLFSMGCLPEEKSIPSLSVDRAIVYSGFEGLTSATTLGPTKVSLTWDLSSDPTVTGYMIYDSTNFVNPVEVKPVSSATSSITITNLTAQKFYLFRVRAFNSKKKFDTNTRDIPVIPYGGVISAEVQDSTSAKLRFNDGSNADAINVFCKKGAETEFTLMTRLEDSRATEVLLSNLEAGALYQCRVNLEIGGFVDNNAETVTFQPVGSASQLAFSVQPGSSNAGVALPTQPVVRVLDINGNVVSAGPDSTALITLTVSINSPTAGTIVGTATMAAVQGVATFSGLKFNEVGVKILTATKSDTSSQDHGSGPLSKESSAFTVSPDAVFAANCSIAIAPSVPPNAALVANGLNSYVVTIRLADKYGNPIVGVRPAFESTIPGDSITQPTQPSDALGESAGSITTTIADSVAPFRMLRISSPAGLTGVTTAAPFVAGPASKLAFVQQPVNSPAGAFGLNEIKVAVQDAQGNTIVSGVDSTTTVSIALSNNTSGALMLGTITANAVNGVATFTGLGIDRTQIGFKLWANSGSLNPAFSNSFNVVPSTPRKVAISSVANRVISGNCSSAITFQLQDQGNNPSNPVANTPIRVTGLGGAQLFSSGQCNSGTPINDGQNITFTVGTNTRTYYLLDQRAEILTITASDPSFVLTSGTFGYSVTPKKLALVAQAPAPAAPGTPLTIVSGRCSPAISVTTLGNNGNAGPSPTTIPITFTGLSANTRLYSDSSCINQVPDPSAAALPVMTSAPYSANFYLVDDRAETLSLSVSDLDGNLITTSGLQTVHSVASDIQFTGPSTVVAGLCSTAYMVVLKDALGNTVVPSSNVTLNINGLTGTANFYTASNCAPASVVSAITFPAGASAYVLYLRDASAETLGLSISDPAGNMNTSQTISVGISPSRLAITGPVPNASNTRTTVCAGPFSIRTKDGNDQDTTAIIPINVTLSGAGTGGAFYSNSSCQTPASAYTFSTGIGSIPFYYKGQYPNASLTFTASDNAAVLSAGTMAWSVTAAPAWIGTSGQSSQNPSSNLVWWQQGFKPTSPRVDGYSSVSHMHFDSTKRYLYVVDSRGHSIHKFDTQTQSYMGWIGYAVSHPFVNISGSLVSSQPTADGDCRSTAQWPLSSAVTPWWCLGGYSAANGTTTTGAMHWPVSVTDDGTYIYVVNSHSHSINRYDAVTGRFSGWIGRINSISGMTNPYGTCPSPVAGSPTPGWCRGGTSNHNGGWPFNGDGGLYYPNHILYHGGSLYVTTHGMVARYNASTGAFTGWVGFVNNNAGSVPTICDVASPAPAQNFRTPGFCRGGQATNSSPASGGFHTPVGMEIVGSTLYVIDSNSRTIGAYSLPDGQPLLTLPNWSVGSWTAPRMLISNGSGFYVSDRNRIARVSLTGQLLDWVGKISNAATLQAPCNSYGLATNSLTPEWCGGGSARAGTEEQAFSAAHSLAIDGNGDVLVSDGAYNAHLGTYDYVPVIKKFDGVTGAYEGMMGYADTPVVDWSNDASSISSTWGFGDEALAYPNGIWNDGTYLYVAELLSSRVKKVEVATGRTLGWIGGVTTLPTGGLNAACTALLSPMVASPGWCLGASANNAGFLSTLAPINPTTVDGVLQQPTGVTGDGTYIYVTDWARHRINRYHATTGEFAGWVGGISAVPTGAGSTDPNHITNCTAASTGTGTINWCIGGQSGSGTGNNMFHNPGDITYSSTTGNLYVVDYSNHRVAAVRAFDGVFQGWVGAVNSTVGMTGCTTATVTAGYVTSVSGWCSGGTSRAACNDCDRGGGFYFNSARGGITTSGTILYVANYQNKGRIDRIGLLTGTFLGSTNLRTDAPPYNFTWSTDGNTITTGYSTCARSRGMWNDGTHLYVLTRQGCTTTGDAVVKVNLTTGSVVGWFGAIGATPTGGASGCSSASFVTPGWCSGGGTQTGFQMGQLTSSAYYITGDNHYIYVSDEGTSRITRIPK